MLTEAKAYPFAVAGLLSFAASPSPWPILRFGKRCSMLLGAANCLMCLEGQDVEYFSRLNRSLDDEKLSRLDAYYCDLLSKRFTSIDEELHDMVKSEIKARRDSRVQKLRRGLWLSSRRGRIIEAIKRFLVRRGAWSSAIN